jgi:hypothetical protein
MSEELRASLLALAGKFDKLAELSTEKARTDEMAEAARPLYRAASGFAAAAAECRTRVKERGRSASRGSNVLRTGNRVDEFEVGNGRAGG